MSDTTNTDQGSQTTEAAEAAAQAAAEAAAEAAAADEGGDGGGDPVTSNGKPFATDGKKSLGYPVETPWREMAPEEQAAYWMHHAKGWQRKAQAGGDDSEEVNRLKTEISELKDAKLTDEQRESAQALESAKQAGIEEAEAHYKPLLRTLLLENVATGVIGDDKAKEWASTVREDAFLTDEGDLDAAAVQAHLRKIYGDSDGSAKNTPIPGTYQMAGQFQPGAKTRPNHSAQADAQLAKRFGNSN